MKTLHILFLSSAEETIGTRARILAKHLVKEGHEVTMVISSRKPALNVQRRSIDGITFCYLPNVFFGRNKLFESLSRASTVFVQTLLNCGFEVTSDFDILHSFDVMGPQNAAPTLLFKILRFLRIHNRKIFVDWDDWWGRGGMFGLDVLGLHDRWPEDPVIAPIVTFLEEIMPLHADGVTVINEILRRRALGVGVKSGNLFVIPNGADVDSIKRLSVYEARERLDLPEESIVYGHFGHLGIESFKLLVQAHNKIVRSFPNAVLLLFRLREDLLTRLSKGLVKSLESRNVIFIGRQPFDKYILYLGASDVLLLPMQDNLFNRARCPLRLGDYLAAGRPIVATALPEIEKVVGECGLAARPGSAEDFADKILAFAKDQELAEQMGKRARELAETRYSWRIIARKLSRAYEKILN